MKEITKIKQAIFLCLPTLVFILLAEIICSFISPKQSVFWENPMMLQYPVKKFDETATRNDLHFSNDPERVVRYVPDKQRWYRLDPEPTIPKDGKLLLHFGDSSTWGWGLNDRGYTYANVLQGLLSDSIHSINLGVPGYTSLQGLKYLESLVKQYHNRIIGITIYFGNNDAVENGLPDSLKLISSQKESYLRNINMWLENHSAFYRVLRGLYSNFKNANNSLPRVNPEQYERNILQMATISQQYNIPIIVIHPIIPLSWKPGYLTQVRSLRSDVKNSWVLKELDIADQFYRKGVQLIMQRNDGYEKYLLEAIEHDWVMSRIKKAWRDKLSKLSKQGITLIHIPEVFIEAEYPYTFEDYCHPSARKHSQIAQKIKEILTM